MNLPNISIAGALREYSPILIDMNTITQRRRQIAKISPRELEVLKLLSTGKSQKMIADKLNLSRYTVSCHLANIYRKYRVHSATQAQSLYNFLAYGIINFEAENKFLD